MADALTPIRKKLAELKHLVNALAVAMADKRTPLAARIAGFLTLAYAASPVDLIPDFIPVLGYLDDLVIIPLGVWLTIRLIPGEVWKDAKLRAATGATGATGTGRLGAAMVLIIWTALAAGLAATAFFAFRGRPDPLR
ncbi:MAG: DUF1232 domain-containing protein [Planctomycetes bacterium]|nr:DUF1232 domain-containing protein [Planctomycetota bacterium]